jgi:hypothetical protein
MSHQSIRHGKKSVRGVSVDVVGRFPQDEFYFQNIKRFHGTRINVIPLRPQEITAFPTPIFFYKIYKSLAELCADLF